jgi:hypothetical protein
MRIAYLDCFSGISGDMFLGAAVDAGVPLEKLQTVAAALGLHAELAASRVERAGIAATKVDVLIHGQPDQPLEFTPASHAHSHEHLHDSGHAHPHKHTHDSEHAHPHEAHAHVHDEPARAHAHRGLPEIRAIISRAPIGAAAKTFALRAFELLAQAEGKIHNRDAESIHFHEVGSEDAIVDIVCSGAAIEAIAADAWYCSALNVGSGTVQCAHGTLPVPAPATAELLRYSPIYSSGMQKELLTPTGAAILRALQVHFQPLPAITLSATGYGAGARDFGGSANLVRLMIGDSFAANVSTGSAITGAPAQNVEDSRDTVAVIEANIDDMNPQLFSYVQQKLLDAGALDAFAVPVQMKKGRPGLMFTVLAQPAQAELLSRILLTETTTLGVRMRVEQRQILGREHVTVESQWGPIRVKLGLLQGAVVNCAPEFEDCRTIAETTGVPLKAVLQEALRLYQAPVAGSKALPGPAPAAGTTPGESNRVASPAHSQVAGDASKHS